MLLTQHLSSEVTFDQAFYRQLNLMGSLHHGNTWWAVSINSLSFALCPNTLRG